MIQEAQLSHAARPRMLCVIEYFAKSLKVIRNDTHEQGMFRPYLYSIPMSPARTVSEIFSVK